jgi:hypothetical protein
MKAIDPAQYQPDEDLYYSDGYVWVTSRRVMHGGGELSLKGARGARVRVVRAEDRARALIVSLAIYSGILALMFFSPNLNIILRAISIFGLLAVPIGLGLVLLALRGDRMPQETIYTGQIRYRFWSRTAVASMDQAYIERIADAIEYAIALRDGTGYTGVTPEFVGQLAKIPSPIISSNTLHVGQTTYDLAQIRSATVVSRTGILSQRDLIWITLIALQLGNGYGYHAEGLLGGVVVAILSLGYLCVLIVMFSTRSKSGEVYTVDIRLRTNRGAIVFASTSKSDATEVQQSIKQEIQPSKGVVTQTL